MTTDTIQRRDVGMPMEATRSGEDSQGNALYDLEEITGNELARQRVNRMLITRPGDIVHRPEWGGGLLEFQNEPPTPTVRQTILNRANRNLKTMELVDDHEVTVSQDADSIRVTVCVDVDGAELEIPELVL